jgi:hypothetical protein
VYCPSTPDAFRPVDWRYGRALALLGAGKRPSRKWDDQWVAVAVRFLRALRRCRDETDRQRLARRMPALYHAHAIHTADSPRARWAVQARMLSGEPFDVIARKCAMTPEAVEAFARLHYDVHDRLGAPDHVACVLIGRTLHEGLTEQNPEVLWKFTGYHGGPDLLDVLIDGAGDEAAVEKLNRFLAADARTTILHKLWIAARALPVTEQTALRVLELFGHLLAWGEEREGGAGTASPIVADVVAEAVRAYTAAHGHEPGAPAGLGLPGQAPPGAEVVTSGPEPRAA